MMRIAEQKYRREICNYSDPCHTNVVSIDFPFEKRGLPI
jgi:hypothetical protein